MKKMFTRVVAAIMAALMVCGCSSLFMTADLNVILHDQKEFFPSSEWKIETFNNKYEGGKNAFYFSNYYDTSNIVTFELLDFDPIARTTTYAFQTRIKDLGQIVKDDSEALAAPGKYQQEMADYMKIMEALSKSLKFILAVTDYRYFSKQENSLAFAEIASSVENLSYLDDYSLQRYYSWKREDVCKPNIDSLYNRAYNRLLDERSHELDEQFIALIESGMEEMEAFHTIYDNPELIAWLHSESLKEAEEIYAQQMEEYNYNCIRVEEERKIVTEILDAGVPKMPKEPNIISLYKLHYTPKDSFETNLERNILNNYLDYEHTGIREDFIAYEKEMEEYKLKLSIYYEAEVIVRNGKPQIEYDSEKYSNEEAKRIYDKKIKEYYEAREIYTNGRPKIPTGPNLMVTELGTYNYKTGDYTRYFGYVDRLVDQATMYAGEMSDNRFYVVYDYLCRIYNNSNKEILSRINISEPFNHILELTTHVYNPRISNISFNTSDDEDVLKIQIDFMTEEISMSDNLTESELERLSNSSRTRIITLKEIRDKDGKKRFGLMQEANPTNYYENYVYDYTFPVDRRYNSRTFASRWYLGRYVDGQWEIDKNYIIYARDTGWEIYDPELRWSSVRDSLIRIDRRWWPLDWSNAPRGKRGVVYVDPGFCDTITVSNIATELGDFYKLNPLIRGSYNGEKTAYFFPENTFYSRPFTPSSFDYAYEQYSVIPEAHFLRDNSIETLLIHGHFWHETVEEVKDSTGNIQYYVIPTGDTIWSYRIDDLEPGKNEITDKNATTIGYYNGGSYLETGESSYLYVKKNFNSISLDYTFRSKQNFPISYFGSLTTWNYPGGTRIKNMQSLGGVFIDKYYIYIFGDLIYQPIVIQKNKLKSFYEVTTTKKPSIELDSQYKTDYGTKIGDMYNYNLPGKYEQTLIDESLDMFIDEGSVFLRSKDLLLFTHKGILRHTPSFGDFEARKDNVLEPDSYEIDDIKSCIDTLNIAPDDVRALSQKSTSSKMERISDSAVYWLKYVEGKYYAIGFADTSKNYFRHEKPFAHVFELGALDGKI